MRRAQIADTVKGPLSQVEYVTTIPFDLTPGTLVFPESLGRDAARVVVRVRGAGSQDAVYDTLLLGRRRESPLWAGRSMNAWIARLPVAATMGRRRNFYRVRPGEVLQSLDGELYGVMGGTSHMFVKMNTGRGWAGLPVVPRMIPRVLRRAPRRATL